MQQLSHRRFASVSQAQHPFLSAGFREKPLMHTCPEPEENQGKQNRK